jgi:predicted PurR-regulated permease PerM
MPLLVDAKVNILLDVLHLLLAALYEVAEIVWPLVFAFVLSLLLKPDALASTPAHSTST